MSSLRLILVKSEWRVALDANQPPTPNAHELRRADMVRCREGLSSLLASTTDAVGRQLAVLAKQFFDEHGMKALSLGWDVVDLFGLDPNMHDSRFIEGEESCPSRGIALVSRYAKLVYIDADSATFQLDTRAIIVEKRKLNPENTWLPVWEIPQYCDLN